MLKEIIILGRGGQGAVTSATILVDAASRDGLEAQGFPFFGAERRGAPVAAFVRVSDRPVRRHGMFNLADIMVVLDPQLHVTGALGKYRLKKGGTLLVNTPLSLTREWLRVAESFGAGEFHVVDATRIARELGLVVAGWPVVNTGVLGAFSRATGLVSLDSIVESIRRYFGGRLGELNARAAVVSYREVKGVVRSLAV